MQPVTDPFDDEVATSNHAVFFKTILEKIVGMFQSDRERERETERVRFRVLHNMASIGPSWLPMAMHDFKRERETATFGY